MMWPKGKEGGDRGKTHTEQTFVSWSTFSSWLLSFTDYTEFDCNADSSPNDQLLSNHKLPRKRMKYDILRLKKKE